MSEFEKFGIDFTFVSNDIDEIANAVRDNTKIIYIETPSNPLLKITDIRAVAELAGPKKIVTALDNTFATPINQNPHDFGIDIIIHSGTKYLGGHSDICCGAALGNKSLTDEIMKSAINFGGSLNASTCYLLERSLKTLSIRIERQCSNAQHIAESLQQNSMIRNVYYPGLESHEGHEIAKRQMKAFGAVVSFELNEGKKDPESFIRNLKLITPALSLGGIESLICSPATTSHEKMSEEDRQLIGITKGLFRLSVGIEDKDDILEDIEQALYSE
jgi:cystathionine beta-lyase